MLHPVLSLYDLIGYAVIGLLIEIVIVVDYFYPKRKQIKSLVFLVLFVATLYVSSDMMFAQTNKIMSKTDQSFTVLFNNYDLFEKQIDELQESVIL